MLGVPEVPLQMLVLHTWAKAADPTELAVVPVQEEQGEGAHHQEEEDPHAETGIVFNGLGGARAWVSPLRTGV